MSRRVCAPQQEITTDSLVEGQQEVVEGKQETPPSTLPDPTSLAGRHARTGHETPLACQNQTRGGAVSVFVESFFYCGE